MIRPSGEASRVPDESCARVEVAGLLVVDVQNDFCPGGALPVPAGDRIVDVLNRYVDRAVLLGIRVYASRDWHPAASRHFRPHGGPWPVHCVQATPGAEFHPALRQPPSLVILSKGTDEHAHGYSAFEGRTAAGRGFLDDLRAHRIGHLYVGGLATEYCVRSSVCDALSAGLRVTVLEDAIAGIDPAAAAFALDEMRRRGATIESDVDLAIGTDAVSRA